VRRSSTTPEATGHARCAEGPRRRSPGQPLPQEQLEQFAKQHGITAGQAKDMATQCQQMRKTAPTKAQ
jgi:hypothetical protein